MVSESDEDDASVIKEALAGSHSASGIDQMPNTSVKCDSSTHKRSPVKASVKSLKRKSSAQAKPTTTSQAGKPQKDRQKSSFQFAIAANSGKMRQTFDLGEFSASTDEEVKQPRKRKKGDTARPTKEVGINKNKLLQKNKVIVCVVYVRVCTM